MNSHVVCLASMPDVPSKTCTTALAPLTSSTWPLRRDPSGSVSVTISANFGNYDERTEGGRERGREGGREGGEFQLLIRTDNSSLEGAIKLKFAPFRSS